MKLSSHLRALVTTFHIPVQTSNIPQIISPLSRIQRLSPIQKCTFTSTSPNLARRNKNAPRLDHRITLIRYFLSHGLTPRPLRFSRLRSLRHWTIHRAHQLLKYQTQNQRERELERLYNSIRAACEELRLGVGDGGRLYRQAMSRKGLMGGLKVGEQGAVAGNGGVPVEYARHQTEGPARAGWDHGWVRGV